MPFSNVPTSTPRRASVIGAIILGVIAVALAASISVALFGVISWFMLPGAWLLAIYGHASFLIPVYLAAGSVLLADKSYRPERLFLFALAVLPLLTVLFGAGLINGGLWSIGLIAAWSIIISAAAVEVVLIFSLRGLLFNISERSKHMPERALGRRYLPSPNDRPPVSEIAAKADTRNQTPSQSVYSPAGEPERIPSKGRFPVNVAAPSPSASRFPDWRTGEALPLASLKAEADVELKRLKAETADSPLLSDRVGQKQGARDETRFSPESFGFAPKPTLSEDKSLKMEEFGQFVLADEEALAGVDQGGEAEDVDWDEIEAGVEEDDEGLEAITEFESGSEMDPPAHKNEPEKKNILKADVDQALAEAEKAAELKSRTLAAASGGQAAPKPYVPAWKKRQNYQVPIDGLLLNYPDGQYWIIDQATRDAAVILKNTLEEFKIQAEVTGIRKGPVITMFEILPAPGVKLSRIVNLQDNIALRLAASSIRIVAPIPGKHAVGIEVPNRKRNIVSFREMIEGELKASSKHAEIPVILGKDISGEAQTLDLVQTPHLLIAGATGSGKSVCVNSMILSILYQRSPAEVRLILIDPKIVELKLYNDIPHLLTPVITEPKRAFQALQYCIYEMERRYSLLDSMGVRDIRSYNKRIKEREMAAERLPYIVVVIDEFADLMATTGKELESTVARLAAMSRAVGVHLVLATQRPSIDVITGLIKANIPSRIAFMVASKMDSRIIIDMVGAEKLLGRGDLLFASAWDPFPIRMQGAYVSEEEVERVVEYVKTLGEPDYIDEEIFYDEEEENEPTLFSDGDDPLYEKALEIVMQQGKASASYIQRRLKIGYNRAARLVEEMEERGIVGPSQGSKPRDLLRAP